MAFTPVLMFSLSAFLSPSPSTRATSCLPLCITATVRSYGAGIYFCGTSLGGVFVLWSWYGRANTTDVQPQGKGALHSSARCTYHVVWRYLWSEWYHTGSSRPPCPPFQSTRFLHFVQWITTAAVAFARFPTFFSPSFSAICSKNYEIAGFDRYRAVANTLAII